MLNYTAFWGATTSVEEATVSGHVIVRIAERSGNHALYFVAALAVLVALPALAQETDDDPSGIVMLLAGILIIGTPALAGLGVDKVVRLCAHPRVLRLRTRIRGEIVLYGASIPFVLARWVRQVTKFPVANISTIAVPLIDKCEPRSGRVRLVGGDGSYFIGKNSDKLQDAMRRWIDDCHMEVQYLLVGPGKGVVEAMQEFRETELSRKNSLSIFVLENKTGLSEDDKCLADVLVTSHPNLISWPDKDGSTNRAMWLEGRHLPDTDVSYDNRWVPPDSMPLLGSGHRSTTTWADTFLFWDKALDDLQQGMVSK